MPTTPTSAGTASTATLPTPDQSYHFDPYDGTGSGGSGGSRGSRGSLGSLGDMVSKTRGDDKASNGLFNSDTQHKLVDHHAHQLLSAMSHDTHQGGQDIFHGASPHSHTNGTPALHSPPEIHEPSSSHSHSHSHSHPHNHSRTKRSQPPPPILLKRDPSTSPSHTHGHLDAAHIPLTPTSAARGSGLNIAGLAFPSEEDDSLADLMPSPNRRAFTAGLDDPTGAPQTPLWTGETATVPSAPAPAGSLSPLSSPYAPLQPPTPSSAFLGFNGGGAQGFRRESLEVPGASSPRRFEPTPHHGLHARNLSLFFPQPGAAPAVPVSPGMPAAETFISRPPQTPDNRGKRRGHHHKHSLSHNFFSFLDPTQTNPALVGTAPALPSDPSPAPTAVLNDTPAPVPMPFTSAPTLSAVPTSTRQSMSRMLGSAAVLQFVLGAGLWVEGQVGGWRCLAAVGYLVVFDAIGITVAMISKKEGGRTISRPYGTSRLVAVLCFAQSVFLAFAAVYIAKEAVEQVLLGAGHEHGHGHDSNQAHASHAGHAGHAHEDERSFPHFLLLCAGASSLVAGALGNHAALVDATGPLFLPNWLTSTAPDLSNPYTLSVSGSCLSILLCSLVVSSGSSMHSLDSAASLVLTLLTIALALPSTRTFAHVLLQTAPPPQHAQMKSLRRALRDVADDKRVLGIGTMRCWQVAPGKAVVESSPSPLYSSTWSGGGSGGLSAPVSRRGSSSIPSPGLRSTSTSLSPMSSYFDLSSAGQLPTRTGHAPLVVTLAVHVHPDSSDRDLLEITRLAWSKVHAAVSGRKEGEVTVQVKRGWE